MLPVQRDKENTLENDHRKKLEVRVASDFPNAALEARDVKGATPSKL